MLQVENIPKDPTSCLSREGGSSPTLIHSFVGRYKEAYELELDHFLSAVLDPALPVRVTREEVLLSSEVADACERSIKEGKMVAI